MKQMNYNGIEFDIEFNSPTIILVQGLPGSGKSTFAEFLSKELGINKYESDDWFSCTGRYIFNQSELMDAHRFCRMRAEYDIRSGRCCIVSNTSTSATSEVRPYEEILQRYGYSRNNLFLIRMETQYKSIHNVPAHIIDTMKTRLEKCLEYYKPDLIIK